MIYIEMLFHFLLGFYIGRKGILQKLKTNSSWRKKLLLTSLVLSLVVAPIYYFVIPEVMPGLEKKLTESWQQVAVVTLVRALYSAWMLISAALYTSILVSVSLTRFRKNFSPLAAFGQMALSNYVMQSLILVPYFLVFNKFNNLPPAEGLMLYIPVLVFQCWFSNWWMTRFTLGPLEWLLRSVTYWEWQHIRRRDSNQAKVVTYFFHL